MIQKLCILSTNHAKDNIASSLFVGVIQQFLIRQK